jgi:CBS domain-containing protein
MSKAEGIMSDLASILDGKPSAIHSVAPHVMVVEAVKEMCRHRIGALLVREGEAIVGIVSERDVMTRLLLHRLDPATTSVATIMTTSVVTVDIETEPDGVMRVMTERRCRHLPVTRQGEVVGLVSIGDLVRWVSQIQEHEVQVLREYVSGSGCPA